MGAGHILSLHVYSTLGGAHSHAFDLTGTLRDGGLVRFEEIFLPVLVQIENGVETQDSTKLRITPRFIPFTCELQQIHQECKPDAFGDRGGGKLTRVQVRGLKGRKDLNGNNGFIVGPVDLESRRGPVMVDGAEKPVLIRRKNISVVQDEEDDGPDVLPTSILRT